MNYDILKQLVTDLSITQKIELGIFLKETYSIFDLRMTVDDCPYCGTTNFVRNGTRNGINRYICKDCSKSFTYKTNTPIYRLQKLNKWNVFIEDFLSLNFSSLTEISDKLEITRKTAHDWRLKLLSCLIGDDIHFTNEEVELDEIYQRLSRKGCRTLDLSEDSKIQLRKWRRGLTGDNNYNVKLFFAVGRTSKKVDLYQSHMGRTTNTNMANYFLPEKFENVTILSDSHHTYKSFFKSREIEQHTFLSKDHVNPFDNNIHNQTINAYAGNFKNMINKHFKGVSTKYISFYMKWYQFICNVKAQVGIITAKMPKLDEVICDKIIKSTNGLEMFRQSEYAYEMFLKANGRTLFGGCETHYYKNKIAV